MPPAVFSPTSATFPAVRRANVSGSGDEAAGWGALRSRGGAARSRGCAAAADLRAAGLRAVDAGLRVAVRLLALAGFRFAAAAVAAGRGPPRFSLPFPRRGPGRVPGTTRRSVL